MVARVLPYERAQVIAYRLQLPSSFGKMVLSDHTLCRDGVEFVVQVVTAGKRFKVNDLPTPQAVILREWSLPLR